jgi:putative ABC transport system substrate-binding protein
LGWTDGRNVRIQYRWGADDAERNRKNAAELVAFAPDVILATGNQSLGPLRAATRIVPTVFVQIVDPVGSGTVASLVHPGDNATGCSMSSAETSSMRASITGSISPMWPMTSRNRGRRSSGPAGQARE